MNHPQTILAGAAVTALFAAAGTPAMASGDEEWTDSTATVQLWADPETVVGESTLRRTADGVQATFQAGEIAPGHAVTLWWGVFNEPQNCSPPGCGEDDIYLGGDPAAGADAESIANVDVVAAYATGTVSSADGSVVLSARIAEGAPGVDVLFGDGALLKDAERAEIHLVLRSHGPAIAGSEVIQTTSFAGGCETELAPTEVADAEGECIAAIQFAIHQP